VVRFDRKYAALIWDKYRPAWVISGQRVNIPLTVVNETGTACTFDLNASQSGTAWPVSFSSPAVFLTAGSATTIQAQVKAPDGTAAGNLKEINLAAICRQDTAIAPTTQLRLTVVYGFWMPLIGR
jgi:hypothetical protein